MNKDSILRNIQKNLRIIFDEYLERFEAQEFFSSERKK